MLFTGMKYAPNFHYLLGPTLDVTQWVQSLLCHFGLFNCWYLLQQCKLSYVCLFKGILNEWIHALYLFDWLVKIVLVFQLGSPFKKRDPQDYNNYRRLSIIMNIFPKLYGVVMKDKLEAISLAQQLMAPTWGGFHHNFRLEDNCILSKFLI